MEKQSIFSGLTLAGAISSLFVFVMPFIVGHNIFYGTINGRYFALIGFTYALVLLFVVHIARNGWTFRYKKRWLLWLLVGTYVVSLVAAFLGVDVEQSFLSDILRSAGLVLIGHVGLMAFLLPELLSKRDWLWIRRTFIVSTVLFSLFYFLGNQGLDIGGRFLTIRFGLSGLTLGNTTFASAYMFFGVMLTLIEIAATRTWSKRFWLWVVSFGIQVTSPLIFNPRLWLGTASWSDAFQNPGIFLGDGRATTIAIGLSVVYLLGRWVILRLVKRTDLKKRIASGYAIAAGAFIAIILGFLFVPGSFVQDAYVEQATGARIVVWDTALEAVAERPILGWGPGNFEFAFPKYFDNRLYLQEFIGEVWFDRAHNVFIDTMIEIGILGLALLVAVAVRMIMVFARAARMRAISGWEAHILGVLVVGHLIQLQTSFETVVTYIAMGLIVAYALWLEKHHVMPADAPVITLSSQFHKAVIVVLLVAGVTLGTVFLVGKEFTRQKALYRIFVTDDGEARLGYIQKATERESSFESLRLASGSFIEGITKLLGSGQVTPELLQALALEASLYNDAYARSLDRTPNDYRLRMNYAYMLQFETILGNTRLDEAHAIADPAFELSPTNPLTYVVDGLSYTYQGDFDTAEALIEEGVALNPGIPMTQQVRDHISAQRATFPTITFLNLENI